MLSEGASDSRLEVLERLDEAGGESGDEEGEEERKEVEGVRRSENVL